MAQNATNLESKSIREIFLANALYDSLEDKALRDVKTILQEKAADPNVILPEQGISPFHYIVGSESISFAEEVTKLFLQHGGDPNVKCAEGMTPVHIAAAWGRPGLLHLLLVNGGNPWIHDAIGKNAFHYAFEEKHWDVVQLLHMFRLMDAACKDDHGKPKYNMVLEKVILSSGDVHVEYSVQSDPVICGDNNALKWKRMGVQTTREVSADECSNKTSDGVSEIRLDTTERESSKENIQTRKAVDSRKNDCNSSIRMTETHSVVNLIDDTPISVDMFSNDGLLKEENKSVLSQFNNKDNIVSANETQVNVSETEKCNMGCKVKKCLFPPLQEHNSKCSNNINHSRQLCRESAFTDTDDSRIRISSSQHYKNNDNSLQQFDIDFQQLSYDFSGLCNLSESQQRSRMLEWLASQSCYTVDSETSSSFHTCDEHPKVKDPVKAELQDLPKVSTETRKCSLLSSALESSGSVQTYISEEYKYTDVEEGVVLLERRLLVNNASVSGGSKIDDSVISSIMSKGNTDAYDTETLRSELKAIGYCPGPITATTKRVYQRQLAYGRRNPPAPTDSDERVYSSELQYTLKNVEWQSNLSSYMTLEQEMTTQFANPDPERRWRQGNIKSCFSYLLLDPRVTENLPNRVSEMPPLQIWTTFLASVFYIGKGKQSRPYSHLNEAVKVWNKDIGVKIDKKVQHILDIWKSGLGVVCLHVFQNVIAVEAFTREAAMIDAVGLNNLTNIISGNYYGKAATWTAHAKKLLGVYLLYRSMLIFLNEGERHLRPGDIG